jgi:hypothetical protein
MCWSSSWINGILYCISATPAPLMSTIVTTRRGGVVIEEPKKRRPGRRPISELMAEDENSLYYIIRQGKVSLQVVTFCCPSLLRSCLLGQLFFHDTLILNWKWKGMCGKSMICIYFDFLVSTGYILICLHLSYSCAW